MEVVFQCLCPVDTKLKYRQMTGSLMVILGILDMSTDLAVAIQFIFQHDSYWASLILLCIAVTNLWSAFKFGSQIYPRKWTYLASLCGFGSFRILVRYWKELDDNSKFSFLVISRFSENMIESIPSAIVQLYAIIFTSDYHPLIVTSLFVSMFSFALGFRTWYKFTLSYVNDDFEREKSFQWWYIVLEVFLVTDFIVRAGSLALFMAVDEFRAGFPYSLIITPIILYLLAFTFDIMDNGQREQKEWGAVFSRAAIVGLTSLGSGFMNLLFSETKWGKIEICVRYIIAALSAASYGYCFDKGSDDGHHWYLLSWMAIFPLCFVVASITSIAMWQMGTSPIKERGESQWQ